MEFKQKIIDFLKKQHVINFKTKNCCWDKFVKDNCQKVGMVCNTWYKSIDYILYTYQNDTPEKHFYKNYKKNVDLASYLKDKRVVVVGPAPYLKDSQNGVNIDSYDVVVRINEVKSNPVDYGEREGDIIISNLNDLYRPLLKKYLLSCTENKKPKFVLCSDSRVSINECVHDIKDDFEKTTGVKIVHLIDNKNEYSDRRHLYWEIYPQKYNEGNITNTDNFNSPYGCINMLLGYDIKELYLTGIDFYGIGLNNSSNKYSEEYKKYYPKDGSNGYGPSTTLHDQLSQVVHFKNVILKHNSSRIKLDKHLDNLLKINKHRLEKFQKFHKKQNRTLK
jgi:hypothetical protein